MPEAPGWLDRNAYPFAPHWLELGAGRMHYIDEGEGDVVLFVHGNPEWSFLYRKLIAGLSDRYRCVAPDHLGFGLSDKPEEADYSPQALADNLGALVDRLNLRDITLVVHDWGGMIGMACALARHERFRRIIVFNSQFWSVKGVPAAEFVSRLIGSAFGRFLCLRFNAFPRLMPFAMGKRRPLRSEVHRQYLAPFGSPAERMAPWTLGKAIIGESDWLESLWIQREKLADRPVLLLWGERDRAFGPEKLERWVQTFPDHQVHRFADVGHFVPEELGEDAVPLVWHWLESGLVRSPDGTTR